MAPMSKKYDEKVLCPLPVRAEWWFRLPSQTRKRIRLEIEEQGAPIGLLIGEVQDRLIARGAARIMGTFMVAMQEGHDAGHTEAVDRVLSTEYVGPQETTPHLMARLNESLQTPAQDDADAEL